MDRAAAVDGLARVEDEVGDHLFKMFAVPLDETDAGIQRVAESDRGGKGSGQLAEKRRQPLRGIDGGELWLLRIGETKDFLRGAFAAADGPRDVAEGVADG